MKTRITLCPKSIFIIFLITTFSAPSFAYREVVNVSPGASPPFTCGAGCNAPVVYREYVVKKYVVVKKHKRHHRRHHIPRCYAPATCTYVPDEVVVRRPCSCQVEHRPPGYKSMVYFRSGPTSYCGTYGYYDESACYSPDYSTGDDDAMVYPDMNIDE